MNTIIYSYFYFTAIEELFEIDNEGNIEIKSKLVEGLYKLTLKAKGLITDSEDIALVSI